MTKNAFTQFVHGINTHDAGQLHALMTPDHVFIDAHDNRMEGKDKMKGGWQGYFQFFPDYALDLRDIYTEGDVVMAFGYASGTYKGDTTNANHFKIPVAIRAIIVNDGIKQWQVYADTKIPFDIMSSAAK